MALVIISGTVVFSSSTCLDVKVEEQVTLASKKKKIYSMLQKKTKVP
jgi:hypothetical protein